jgi:tetratricopeptide (TPR) repeat protein
MSYQLPPLDDPAQFERLVRDILRLVYDDPGIELFGRSGQSQSGIDGFSPSKSGVTFQCKLKDVRFGGDDSIRKTLLAEMEEELTATSGLLAPPGHFIFATTFKNDRQLQEKAQTLSNESLTVEYWGWDTITEKIWEYANYLIPQYYPDIPIRQVPGFRKITRPSLEHLRIEDPEELRKLAIEYYTINDRDEVVSRVVSNDIDVRNDGLMSYLFRRIDALPSSATLWILGNGGAGKTTLLHRLAVELAQKDQNVFMLNLEYHLSMEELRSVLSRIGRSALQDKQTILCIDNPAADEEILQTLLRELPDYCEKIHVLFSERLHRYQTLKKTDVQTYIHGEEEQGPVNVGNPRDQRYKVYERLFDLMQIAKDDREPLRAIALNEKLVYVNATYSILLELKKARKIKFDFDWDDYRKKTEDLPAFVEGYKYIALFYLFGVKTPFTGLRKVFAATETESQTFLGRFRGFVNEPVVVYERRDGLSQKQISVRTKHEIVSEIFFREYPGIDKNELLMEWCEHADFADPVEAQALINIFGTRKNSISEEAYVDFLKLVDFLLSGHLNEKVRSVPKLEGALNLAKFWLLLSKQKVEDAIATLKAFIEKHPGDFHGRTELAKIYQRQGRLSEAETALLMVLNLKPDDVNSRTELAKIYQRQNRLEEAKIALFKVLDIRHNDRNSRLELAKVYQKEGFLNLAEGILLDLLEIDKNNFPAFTELSKIYQRQGKLDKAEAILVELLELEPRGLHPRTELARIYQRQNKLDKAEAILVELLELNSENLQARTELAKIYQRQNKLDKAEALLLESLEIESNHLHARTELAKIYQRQGKLAQAEKLLLESLEIDNKQLHPRTELAKIYQRQNNLDKAEAILVELLELNSENLQARTELAKIYQRQGKLDKAEALLLESLEIDNKQLHPRTELAKIYQRQGKLDKAEALLLESLEIDDKQLHPRTELAKIYQRQNKLDKAEAILVELLELDSENLQARTELAKIYQRQGLFEKAETIAEEGLQMDPLNDHAMSELLSIWNRLDKKEKGAKRFAEFILQPNYRFTRYTQAPVFRFFQFCRAFNLKEEAKKIFERFESELDDQNIGYYRRNFPENP